MKISHLLLAATLVLAMSLTLSCSSDGGSSGSKKTVKKEKISGVSQKGPFIAGSTVKLYELNENYERTGKIFGGKVKGDDGIYEIVISDYLASPYVDMEATGRYVNEITNTVSADNVTLKAIADVSDKDNVNINVITHLEYDKVLYWLKQGLSFADAKNQALAEVLAELGIDSPAFNKSENMTLQADSVLLLASVLLQVGRTESALKTLLSTLVGIATVKNGMEQALAIYGTAKSNVQGSTPISPSSSSRPSSSSGGSSSSGDGIIINCPNAATTDNTVACGGQTYRTTKIGNVWEQVWMAENLNYDVSGSVCYDNDPANCGIYGRLYNWATAMANSASSNLNPSGVKGICPDGWHLPSNAEWDDLIYEVGNKGTNVKKIGGWNSDDGTDDYGFSALPGGRGGSDGKFSSVGDYSYWWSATQQSLQTSAASYSSISLPQFAREVSFYLSALSISAADGAKTRFLSVRCVKDREVETCPDVEIGNNTMTCGGQTYRTVNIGEQTWMAQNLNYATKSSKCNGDLTSNCETFGRLYIWRVATKVCPSGWHLPTDNDWNKLTNFVGSDSAGTKLKAPSHWRKCDTGFYWCAGEGTDNYGFSALPSGEDGGSGDWWSASTSSLVGNQRPMQMSSESAKATIKLDDLGERDGSSKFLFYSVRCLKD